MPKLDIHNIETFVQGCVVRYGLPRDMVIEEVEQAMSEAMSYVTGYTVEAWLDVMMDGLDVQMFGYIQMPDYEIVTKVIELESITKNTVKLIVMRSNQRLEICASRREAASLRHIIGRVYEGEVAAHPDRDIPLRVELQLGTFGLTDSLTCFCSRADQPPHERGVYRLGETRMWLVKRVDMKWHGDTLGVIVALSRASLTLPQVLIQKACEDKMKPAEVSKIYCVERQVGFRSIIAAPAMIPKEVIKRVSRELDEEVVIWRQDKFRQDSTGRHSQQHVQAHKGKALAAEGGGGKREAYAAGARA